MSAFLLLSLHQIPIFLGKESRIFMEQGSKPPCMMIPHSLGNLSDGEVCFHQHKFGVCHTFILNKLRNGTAIELFKGIAQFGLSHAGDLCQMFRPNIKGEMIFDISLYGIQIDEVLFCQVADRQGSPLFLVFFFI